MVAEREKKQLEGYLSVKEAAGLLGVSPRTVYAYIEARKLPAYRIGRFIAIDVEAVRSYQKAAVGRPPARTPEWHVPAARTPPALTTIRARLREGQEERLTERLNEMRDQGKHLIPGTVARYITRSQDNPDEVQILLAWSTSLHPSPEELELALTDLRADLADLLEWETAVQIEQKILLHT